MHRQIRGLRRRPGRRPSSGARNFPPRRPITLYADRQLEPRTRESTHEIVMSKPQNDPDNVYLPDFCNIRMVFAMVVAAELLAYILALSHTSGLHSQWHRLIVISLFVQWVVLPATALLCISRRFMVNRHHAAVTLYSFALVTAVTMVVSEAAYWLGQHTDLILAAREGWYSEFVIRNLTISAIVTAVALRYFYVQHQLKKNIEAEADARLQALQARVRPHFLFNSMNTIASLTRSQPALAEEVVEDLADLFRVNLADARTRIPLKEELALTRRYLHIEQLRLGERLQVMEDLQVPDDADVPMLTIQPLVENAVYHGIEPHPDGGTICIKGWLGDDGNIVITVSNPHPGQDHGRQRQGHHMALDNVRQRLHAHFADQGRLTVQHGDQSYEVTLTFPYQRGES